MDGRKTVLVGMSGGVDSSVAAALLQQQGFRVVGGFIKNWSDSKDLWTGECQWRGERRDVLRVASRLGIPLLTFDFEDAYRKAVVDDLFRGYEAGETPNPDVLCNEFIKFGLFADEGKRLGFDYVATGHYAKVGRSASGPVSLRSNSLAELEMLAQTVSAAETGPEAPLTRLFRGADPGKDQSYFLYRVPQEVLRRTLFPIGNLKKSDVRQLAKEFDLPVAEKPDSQGICFIGKLDMADFLRKKIPSRPGEIVDENGTVLSAHDGLDGYTIGQRERILISKGAAPWFVARKDLKANRLVVVQGADHPLLYRIEATMRDMRWISGHEPKMPLECEIQVRYRQEPVRAVVDGIRVTFQAPVKAVAAGQSAVLYQGDECLGGGIISNEP